LSNRMSEPDSYAVHVSRKKSRKYSMMRFNVPSIELNNWNKKDIEIERDMSKKRSYDLKSDALPQFGEGSEYRAREKEIARKMLLGHKIKKFDIEAQNWKLSVSDFVEEKEGKKKKDRKTKKFTGVKVGGIDDSSMYFVMHQREGGIFEAFPVEDWYNFKPEIKHRTLNFEEAEAEWERRDQIINKYALMQQKRDDDVIDDVFGDSKSKASTSSGFKIHGAEDDRLSDDDEFKRDRTKASRGKKNVSGKTLGGEAYEDSDDGDDEGQEVDYMSDDSDDFDQTVKGPAEDPDQNMRGVDEEQKSSSSESSDDEEEDNKDAENDNDDDDDDSDIDGAVSSIFKPLTSGKVPGQKGSRSNTPTEEIKAKAEKNNLKRVRESETSSPSLKRPRDSPTPSGSGISIEAVRNILSIKPTPTRELLKKFKSKKTGLTQEQTLERIASIMRTLKPDITKSEREGQTHYFIPPK